MSSGQCTEGGLRLGREHAVEENGGAEGRSEQEGERSFGRERENEEIKSEGQEVRQRRAIVVRNSFCQNDNNS